MFRQKRIYADAAAATPLRKEVRDELVACLALVGNPGSIHREGVEAHARMEKARAEAGEALRAHPREIIFVSGGTEANNLALKGAVEALKQKPLHLITTAVEHPSVLECLRALAAEGHELTELPVGEEGTVSMKDLQAAIREHTALISIQYVNSETGVVQDVREIAKVIRRARKERKSGLPLIFHTDASQAPLYLSCDVPQLGVDLMTLDGQKMMGPKGAGLLFVKTGVELMPLLRGGGQEKGLRSGTENVPLAAACARALFLAQRDYKSVSERVGKIRDVFVEQVHTRIAGAELNGSATERIANNANVYIPDFTAELAVLGLDAKGIAASARSACDMAEGGASYVLRAMGKEARAEESLRFTFLPDITQRDAMRIAETLADLHRSLPYRPNH